MSESAGSPGRGGRCPVCGKPTVKAYRPFCSIRCADVDLSRWLRGAYAIPAREPIDDERGAGNGEKTDGAGKDGSEST